MKRGYFAIGIYAGKTQSNIGSLFRTAHILEADFIFTVNDRYSKQASDTMKTWKHKPLFFYKDTEDFLNHLPKDASLIGIELNDQATSLHNFVHPERAIYLLGAEDIGLPINLQNRCDKLVKLPGEVSMNVAVAGSIVLYHRYEQFMKGKI